MVDFYKSVEESPNLLLCELTSAPPSWLHGSLLRVGPGLYEYGRFAYKHAFDGDAIIHAFKIENGEVWYRSKYLRSNSFLKSIESGELKGVGYGGIPPSKLLELEMLSKSMALAESDNCNDVITTIRNRTCVATDSPFLWIIDEESLDTLKRLDMRPIVNESDFRSWAAHNHIGSDGTYYNVSNDFTTCTIQFLEIPCREEDAKFEDELVGAGSTNARILAEIPVSDGRFPYHHSFAITENFMVFFKLNYFVQKDQLETIYRGMADQAFLELFKWDPSAQTIVYIISRAKGCVVGAHLVNPCFIFHHGNAYETEDKIVVDVCCYESNEIIVQHSFLNLMKNSPTQTADLRRYEFPKPRQEELEKCRKSFNTDEHAQNAVLKEFVVLRRNFELPAINYQKYNGKPYKFMYGSDGQSLLKIHVDTKEVIAWNEIDCAPGEPTFVEAPGACEEDDGVLLLSVIGLAENPSFMLVLDAKTLKEVCRAKVEGRLPVSFHGIFKGKLSSP